MRLHLVYRLYPGENNKRRPPYYSKLLCLRSAVASLAHVQDARLLLLVDADALPEAFAGALRAEVQTEQIVLGGVGNAGSYERQMQLVNELPAADLVYLSEDDYLYCPDAFPLLVAAAEELEGEVDYYSLYDHPDRYILDDDARLAGSRPVWLAGGRHWRWAESTCMSFGARVGTIRADSRIHQRFSPQGSYRDNPVSRMLHLNDRRVWRRLQGLGSAPWHRSHRRLATPIPSLSTHMDEAFLAPVVDWLAVAEAVQAT